MQQPPGLEEGNDQTVWKLNRALYGMKQSGKLWYNELKGTLKNFGYRPAVTDPCVFTREHGNAKDIITVYVDDLLVTGTADRGRLDIIVAELGNIYSVTNLGIVRHLLGISIGRAKNGLRLDQTAFLRKTLEEVGTLLTPRSTPWDHRSDEDDPGDALDVEGVRTYRRLLGRVMYASNCTRPDIAFAVSNLSRWMQEPRALHQRKLTRLFQYLTGTLELGLLYQQKTGTCEVTAYSDAALGRDRSQGRGRSGIIVKLGEGPVCWGSRTQQAATDSSQAARRPRGNTDDLEDQQPVGGVRVQKSETPSDP